MTIFEFAIARRFNQLQVERDARMLKQAEWQLLGTLAVVIDRYRARETNLPEEARFERPSGGAA